MKTNVAIIGCVSTALVLWALIGQRSTEEQPVQRRPATSRADAPAIAVTGEFATLRRIWRVGQSRSYDAGMSVAMWLAQESSQESADAQAPSLTVTGRWTETVLSAEPDLVTLGVRFALNELHSERFVGTESDLQRPFVLYLAPDGRLSRASFAEGVAPQARHLLRSLATAAQFSAPDDRRRRWSTAESDVTGRYEARYIRTSEATVELREKRYTHLVRAEGLTPIADERALNARSITRYTIDRAGHPTDIDSAQRLVIATGVDLGSIHSQSSARFELITTGWSELSGFVEAYALTEDIASRPAIERAEHDRQLLAGADYRGLRSALTEVAARDRDSERARALAQLHVRFAALYRQDEAALDKALADVLSGQVSAREAGVMVSAMGKADTEEAREALLTVLEQADDPVRAPAVTAAAFLERADSRMVAALQQIHDTGAGPLRNAAVLALGSVARRSSEVDTVPELIEKLSLATDNGRIALVDALGNSGDARALPHLLAAIEEGGYLAERAVYGLRFIPGVEVDAALRSLLGEDVAHNLALEAVRAIAYRSPDQWRPILEQALETAATDTLRNALAVALTEA